MCSPMLFMAGAGAMAGLSSLAAGSFAEDIGQFNQQQLERQADTRIETGKVEEQTQRIKTAQMKGAQRTAFGASGVDVSVGSPVDVLSDTAAIGELDALTIRSNAETEAFNLRVGGVSAALQGKLEKRKGQSQAVGSILTTAGSMAAL